MNIANENLKENWKEKCLNETRLRYLVKDDSLNNIQDKNSDDGRTAFDSDYSRIINSAALRRLQDKAQVFPLKKGDFVRSRLTHSLEVSHFGHTMGLAVSKKFREDDILDPSQYGELSGILSTAGLVHDLGNPPFGHFGEVIIQNYFKKFFKDCENKEYIFFNPSNSTIEKSNLEEISIGEDFKTIDEITYHILTKDEIKDLCAYDGNAQTFRILSKLHYQRDRYSFNLTLPTLATVIKYPLLACEEKNGKFGYFLTEKGIYEEIKKKLNLNGRHPIVYLLEAADDIAYSVADIEDGVKKGIFNVGDILVEFINKEKEIFKGNISKEVQDCLSEEKIKKEIKEKGYHQYINDFKKSEKILLESLTSEENSWYLLQQAILLLKYYKDNNNYEEKNLDEIKIQELRVFLQSTMLIEVQKYYIENIEEIFKNFPNEPKDKVINILEKKCDAKYLREVTKKISKKIFSYHEIVEAEILGHKVLTTILEKLVSSILSPNWNNSQTYEGKVCELISYNYKFINFKISKYKNQTTWENPHIYDRLRMVIDFVSGMTDTYALELYKKLSYR